jgi:hypothetical protein
MVSQSETLLVISQRWYAWMMLPGYTGSGNLPYCSPIFLKRVTPLHTGQRLLELTFINAGYAEGVQDFTVTLRILKHTPVYLVAALRYGEEDSERTAIISAVTGEWLARFCPEFLSTLRPINSTNDVQSALSAAFFRSHVTDGTAPLAIRHRSILIRINVSYSMDLSPLELYEATRGVWRVDARRVERVELAFAVYRGIICEVYRITGWYPSGTTRYTTRDDSHFTSCDPPRMEFEGVVADDVRHLYVGQSVKHYFARGSANPITYVNV